MFEKHLQDKIKFFYNAGNNFLSYLWIQCSKWKTPFYRHDVIKYIWQQQDTTYV